jgi:hypothetical protein
VDAVSGNRPVIACDICGSEDWFACRPATAEVWCRMCWPQPWTQPNGKDDTMKGTHSSSGPTRVTGTSGAPKSHVVAKGTPPLNAGGASKPAAASQHAGAFKSRPGKGNTA